MDDDPFAAIDTSELADADRIEIDRLRQIYQNEGEDGLVNALVTLARSNSPLFMALLGATMI
jgi:hypothetical protein